MFQSLPRQKSYFYLAILAGVGLALLVHQAAACELAADVDPQTLNHKPLIGDSVRLTSGFGLRTLPLHGARLHTGIDWAGPKRTLVIAAAAGRILSITTSDALGTTIIIDHREGWRSLYANLSQTTIAEATCVSAGDVIGVIDAVTPALGPTLHFEVHQNGRPIDPLKLPARN